MGNIRVPPLNVIIVGAGIGGLTTALGLLQAGQKVHIFEKSKFANEVGAALALPSNLSGPFMKLQFDPDRFGANQETLRSFYTKDGQLMFENDFGDAAARCIHRVDLHEALRQAVLDAGGEIHLSSQITSIDPNTASITLNNNQVFTGDALIGADGIHSIVRPSIVPNAPSPSPFHISMYRMLIPHSTLTSIPKTQIFLSQPGKMTIFTSADGRRIVAYPCRSNTIMNVAALFPTAQAKHFDTNDARREHLMSLFTDFDDAPRALIAAAKDPSLWTLYDMPALETWNRGRAVIMGDAAHPTLPYAAQGGAQAVEDAVTLAVVLGRGTRREEVEDRLKLFSEIRYERAKWVQDFARGADQSSPENPGVKPLSDPAEFFEKVHDHDAWAVAEHKLEMFWERGNGMPTDLMETAEAGTLGMLKV